MRAIEKDALLQLQRFKLGLREYIELHGDLKYIGKASYEKQLAIWQKQVDIALEYCRWIEANPNYTGDEE